jgi:hypothetical protein
MEGASKIIVADLIAAPQELPPAEGAGRQEVTARERRRDFYHQITGAGPWTRKKTIEST